MAFPTGNRLRQRVDEVLRSRGLRLIRIDERLHARAPDDFILRGVRLDLGDAWATPWIRAAIYDGYYETPEAKIIEATVLSSDRVLEIGCGVGFLGTIAGRIAASVRCYDANPTMAATARDTLERNGVPALVVNAVLQNCPTGAETAFYVHDDFWTSSLAPDPAATEIRVPVLDLGTEIADYRASYLVVDIEGGETDLLRRPIPTSVLRVCVECHPAVSSPAATAGMLTSLEAQGFAVNVDHSLPPVLYLERPARPPRP